MPGEKLPDLPGLPYFIGKNPNRLAILMGMGLDTAVKVSRAVSDSPENDPPRPVDTLEEYGRAFFREKIKPDSDRGRRFEAFLARLEREHKPPVEEDRKPEPPGKSKAKVLSAKVQP